jgi:hypothetical protein
MFREFEDVVGNVLAVVKWWMRCGGKWRVASGGWRKAWGSRKIVA